MKNFIIINKSKLFLLFVFFILTNCKNNDEDLQIEKCGCNSVVTKKIPESANLIGEIKFKTQLDPNDTYYNNKFWITYVEANCVNCVHHMIVCNENILPQEILKLKNSSKTISVKFSGDLKEICEKIFAPADYTYENITLTTIQIN